LSSPPAWTSPAYLRQWRAVCATSPGSSPAPSTP
jgi:hypothetical protein